MKWPCSVADLNNCSNLNEFYLIVSNYFLQLIIIAYGKRKHSVWLVANDSWMSQMPATLVAMQAGRGGRVKVNISLINLGCLGKPYKWFIITSMCFIFFPATVIRQLKCLTTVIPMWICSRLFFTAIPSQDFSSASPDDWYTWKNYQQKKQETLNILVLSFWLISHY